MRNLWDSEIAAQHASDDLATRVYSSRLLGQEPALVLHGGGNTSVKSEVANLFGEREEVLHVKGSGWDLATIEVAGFAPVKMRTLLQMAQLPELSDHAMVQAQRAAMLDPAAPNPSVEAILHALIPFKFVDHTHADAVVTISNTPDGKKRIRELYGERVLIVPYVMPGFILARKIYHMCQGIDWQGLDGMVLMHHGIFTFSDSAEESYGAMIKLVTQAEEYLAKQGALIKPQACSAAEELLTLAKIRQAVSAARHGAVIARWERDDDAVEFSNLPNLEALIDRGPLTPDHVIRTKRSPVIIRQEPQQEIAAYIDAYHDYFHRNSKGQELSCLNPAPCWAVWPGSGSISFGRSCKEADIVADITAHTRPAIRSAELLGGWQPLAEAEIFSMEYWELEQAKLGKGGAESPLQGKVAIVTGAASGIGLACVAELRAQGAAVAALDLDPKVKEQSQPDVLGIVCDLTDRQQIQDAVEETVHQFGGIDILISNAGAFFASEIIEQMTSDSWDSSLAINLSSHQRLLQACIPYLQLGVDPAVVMIASKNVPAPGPGAAAYSAAKAGQTQLARVAALELGSSGVRVNTLHPDAVFDTAIWTPEVLAARAEHYSLTVEQYKTKNILQRAVSSHDVAALACAMAGPLFSCTTGAQIPVDGGNERVI